MDFTFIENCAVYPRLISDARADESIVNTADIVADHVYQPDGCVWGRTGRKFVQTFTATQSELVSITLLVASGAGTFRATLVEGGPGGRQIGPAKTFKSGSSLTWGHARWGAGQAPLVGGRTYGIRIARTDGKAWTPYLHSTGNAYDGGLLHVDDIPYRESDLAVWIVQQPDHLVRASIAGADPGGWVYSTKSVTFLPRSKNVRLVTLAVSPVTAKERSGGYVDLVARVVSPQGKVIAGPKRCLAVGAWDGPRTAHFLFARDECPVKPGGRYGIDVYTVGHKQAKLPGSGAVTRVPRDIRARVYGEPRPRTLPGIYNLSITCDGDSESRLKFAWSQPLACPTTIESWGPGVNGGKRFDVPAGKTRIVIPKFWAGHRYELRLTSVGPTGLKWSTPRYQVQMPRGEEFEPIVQPAYHKRFVPLAAPELSAPPDYGPLRYQRRLTVVNDDFEQDLAGWKVAGGERIYALESEHKVGVKRGKKMAGWTRIAGQKRQQVFTEGTLSQQIATTPGHVYVMSAWAHTSVVGGPRGDTRVRLFADPAGGDELGGANSSQWYWTDGKWMRFQHRWVARADKSTIGLGLFRWRDLERASAYVDQVTVFDLGPAPPEPGDPPAATDAVGSLALVDPKDEAADKVEGHLKAPPGYVITGIGARAHYDNITTMWLRIQPLLPNGTLGKAEQLRGGWELDAGLEAEVKLPPTYIATGFGAAVAPEWDVKRFRVWARPLLGDGTLGEEKEFRGGADLVSGVEKSVRLKPGRVLTGVGLNCMFNDINGIQATSAALIDTATRKSTTSAPPGATTNGQAGEGRFYVPANPKYTITDSVLDSIRFTLDKTLRRDERGHLVSISSFVDPEGKVMGWHDFGNLEGPGWAANAVGGAYEIHALGEFLKKPDWQKKALAILDHVLDGGFIDRKSGLIRGYRETTTGKFCLNYKHNSDWFCPGSMAKVAFQLLIFADRLGDDPRAKRMRSAAVACAAWIDTHCQTVPNGWYPRRTTPQGKVYRKSPDGGNDTYWQTSGDGLFILQLQAALTQRKLADYRKSLKQKTAVFIRAGGIFGSINHDTYDPHENVAYSVAFRTLLSVSRLLEDETIRTFAYTKCLGGLDQFKMCQDRNGVATKGLLYMEKSWDTAYLWENAEAALAYFEAAVDTRQRDKARARQFEIDGLVILRASAKHHYGPHGFLTEGVDWNNHVGRKHHIDQARFAAIQYTEPFLNNQHIAEGTLYYLKNLAVKSAKTDATEWRDIEDNVILKRLGYKR